MTAATGLGSLVSVTLDRVQIGAQPIGTNERPPKLDGFRGVSDSFVRSQTTIRTWERLRRLVSNSSGAQVSWRYRPQVPWLPPWKITVIAGHGMGISNQDLEPILANCKAYRFLLVEIAFDFKLGAKVDRDFVRQHALFGRSRRRIDRGGPGQLRYGSRKSAKLVRCYFKPEVSAYRVELELHSQFLKAHSISKFEDLAVL